MGTANLDGAIAIGQAAKLPPVLAPIGNQQLDPGVTLAFALSAIDPEGQPLTYSATDPDLDSSVLSCTGLPADATLTDRGDGSAEVVWLPRAAARADVICNAIDVGGPPESDSERLGSFPVADKHGRFEGSVSLPSPPRAFALSVEVGEASWSLDEPLSVRADDEWEDEGGARLDCAADERVGVADVEMEREGGPADRGRSLDSELGVFVGEHEGRVTERKLCVADATAGLRQAELLLRAEGSRIEFDRAGCVPQAQVGEDHHGWPRGFLRLEHRLTGSGFSFRSWAPMRVR